MPTKTELPPLFRRHIRRPRLTRILDASSAQTILLLAPAGYGKTTLAAEWLQGNDEAMWYRATPASADVAAFSAGVADVLQPLIPGAGDRLKQRLRIGDAPEHAAQALAELLAEDLAAWPENAWLVVDDYHLVMESKATEEFVEALLMTSNVRAAILSRKRPTWATTRRQLYGEILELRADVLRMTTAEGKALLEGQANAPGIEKLVAAADGWPFILGLAAISGASATPADQLTEQLFAYLAEEVIASEGSSMTDFLLRISILPVIDRGLIGVVCSADSSDTHRLLDEATTRGLLRRVNSTYSFHPLLREFLRAEFRAIYSDSAGDIAEMAAARLMGLGRADEAFGIAAAFSRSDLAFTIANEACDGLLEEGRLETLERWLSVCGVDAIRPCRLALARAEMLIRKGKPHEAEASAVVVAERADKFLETEAWCQAGKAAYWLSAYQRAAEFYDRARTSAERPEDRLNAAWGAFLTAHAQGDVSEGEFFAALAAEVPPTASVDAQLRLMVGRQMVSARTSWSSTWDEWQRCLAFLPHASPASRTAALVNLAWLKCVNADFETSRGFAAESLRLSEEHGLSFGVAHSVWAIGQAEVGLRQFGRARRSIRRLTEFSSKGSDAWLSGALAILRIRYELSQGSPEGALETVLEEVRRIEEPQALEIALGLGAIAAAATGEPFTHFARSAYELAPRRQVYVAGALRFADVLGGAAEGRVQRLTAAVRASIAEGSMDSFVLSYRARPELLSDVDPFSPARGAIERVLIRAGDRELAHKHLRFQLPAQDDADFGLTRRELEVFGLVASGYTNRAIAEALVISPSTAKVHVHHIMNKLGTRSRFEARLMWERRERLDRDT